MLPGYPTRRSSRRKGRKRGKVTSHAQNVLGHACIFMHILAQGSDPIVGVIMNGRRCEGRWTGTDGRRGEDPALSQPGMLRSGRLVDARLHPSSVGDEPCLSSACQEA